MSLIRTVNLNPDTPASDAFSRLRVSSPEAMFDCSFEYSLMPLLFDRTVTGTGAAITHDSTNRCAQLAFTATATGGEATMTSFTYTRYQPGRSHLVFLTGNFMGGVADCTKFIGYSSGGNGVEYRLSGTTKQICLLSDTAKGDETVAQADWNLDKLDGTGPSGLTLPADKTFICVIDLQWLGVGRVRVGFDIGGVPYWAHEFTHAGIQEVPYMQSASLPVRCGMVTTGTVTTTMRFICASVISEGGQPDLNGFGFTTEFAKTAASGARTYMGSIRPAATWSGFTNRTHIVLDSVDALVTGTNPVLIEICLGQAITTPTYAAVGGGTYSTVEADTAGTLSGSPAVVLAAFYVASSAGTKSSIGRQISARYPITLSAAGAVRDLGTVTVLATGISGTSATRVSLGWKEVR